MLRLFCSLATLLFFCLCLAPGRSEAAPSPFRVLDYTTEVRIETNADITVTETITVDIPTSGTNKGIIRDIPVNPRWRDKGRQKVRLQVESAAIDGKPCRRDDVELTEGLCSIYMRDVSSYLSAGQHVFVLRYRMSEQLGFFPEYDELNWNAIGRGWDGGVQRARAIIYPPAGTSFLQHKAWLGSAGSQESPVTISPGQIGGKEALVFEATRPMREGEDFTCAVMWEKGVVAPSASIRPAEETFFTFAYALCLLASLAAAWLAWRRYGRDPQAGPVIPLFYPPQVPPHMRGGAGLSRVKYRGHAHGEEYLSAAAVNYVHNGGRFDSRGVAALLLSLAMRGACHLHGNTKKGFLVEKGEVGSPVPEEQSALECMPERLTIKRLRSTENPLARISDACLLRLEDYDMLVSWKLWPQLLLFLAALVAVGSLVMQQLAAGGFSELMVNDLTDFGVALGFLLGGLLGGLYIIWEWCTQKRVKDLIVFCCCVGALVFGVLACTHVEFFWMMSAPQCAMVLLTLLIPLVFCFFMDAPTPQQVDLQQQVKGLALYIGTAETQRFNLANPPEENLELYHRLLPYAVALGLEDAWGARFADKLREAMRAGDPQYDEQYSSVSLRGLIDSSKVSMSAYQEALREKLEREYASSSGGGSAFSGGGGAGSGGGGGGGRAC